MRSQTVSILEGNNFVVSDVCGDIDASPTDTLGLFNWDTRFLSRWRLTVDGKTLNPLSTDDLHYYAAQFFLVPGMGTMYTDAALSVVRRRSVGDGFHEDITVANHSPEQITLAVRIEAAADFADLFEVKDALTKKGEPYHTVETDGLVLGYRRESYVRETRISASAPEAQFDEYGITFNIQVPPHAEWTTCIDVAAVLGAVEPPRIRAVAAHAQRSPVAVGLDDIVAAAPHLSSSWAELDRTYARSVVDLAALRFFPRTLAGNAVPAAGLPWFMTLFGRDTLITTFQALPFAPGLAEAALRILADRQGRRVDPFRDEEPGKILHEQRFGELTAFEERPHSPYYGSADSTPLFLILLDEYQRWTGDLELVRELEPVARKALDWIDQYGDRDGDGYVEYQRGNDETGLENQCWKDSWNSVVFANGTLARLPRATCEIQGYVYDARIRSARLARSFWEDAELATRLEQQAAGLKRQFNNDFWLADRQFFALALDGDKQPVDSLTSNIGHLLWSGIVEDDKVEAVVGHLMSDALFSGWGVRTMAVGEGAYNPIGYHVGTVWPHDNSIIAHGLRRCGYQTEATRVAQAILEAAAYFDGRLPEAFAGYTRKDTSFPVEYPTACSPQAWATGAPLLMLRAILGLEPDKRELRSDPLLPERIGWLELRGLFFRGGRADVVAGESGRAAAAGETLPAPHNARELFATLDRRVDTAALAGIRGSCRFDVHGAGHWRVLIADGATHTTESDDDAQTVFDVAEDVLLGLASGEQNPTTALLSGRLAISGDLALGSKVSSAMFKS
jgi:glycogen debranching enzyme